MRKRKMTKSICSGLALSFILVAVSTARADQSEIPQVKSERSARNAIYIELGGNGAWYSLNYERFVMDAGATLMYFSGSGSNNFSSSITASGFVMAPTATVGYRYVPTDGGFNFKAGFTPFLIAAAGQTHFFPWAGIAAGYGF